MPSKWTIKPERHLLIIYVLLALLIAAELINHPIPLTDWRAKAEHFISNLDWRAKAERFAINVWPVLRNWTGRGSYASSDRFLMVFGLNRPSETVVSIMSELAPDETAVFVGPMNDPAFSQLYFTFSYLSWPHRLAVLGCSTGGAPPQIVYRPRAGERVARAFFYLQPPPSRLAAESRAFGPKLKLIQVAKGEEWTSFCSQ